MFLQLPHHAVPWRNSQGAESWLDSHGPSHMGSMDLADNQWHLLLLKQCQRVEWRPDLKDE